MKRSTASQEDANDASFAFTLVTREGAQVAQTFSPAAVRLSKRLVCAIGEEDHIASGTEAERTCDSEHRHTRNAP